MEPEIRDHIEDKEHERKSTIGVAGGTAEEEEDEEEEGDGNSRINTDGFERPGTSGRGGEDHHEQSRAENSDDHVIDVDRGDSGGDCREEEKICRICHLSTEPSSGTSGLMQLGCHCRAELGLCHPHCAETWFKHRGNSVCEICGVRAKNVKFVKNYNSRMFIVDFDDIRPITTTPITASRYPSSEEGSQRCKQSCCNFLVACLVLGLVVPWFFRANLF